MRLDDQLFMNVDDAGGSDAMQAESTPDVGGSDASPADSADDGAIYSENGSFRLTRDAFGVPRVEMNMPKQEEDVKEQEQTPAQTVPAPAVESPTDALQGLVGGQYTEPTEYTPNEFVVAMQLGQVDESRIPEMYRSQYQVYKQNNIRHPPSGETAVDTQATTQTDSANATQYYARINTLAEDMAKKELGITDDELEMGEYSDDENVVAKVKAYKVAVESNRGRILADVQAHVQRESQVQAEYKAAQDAVKAFYMKESKAEPNFAEIDKMMANRINDLPYKEAVKLAPILDKLKNGTITRAELPMLEQFYKDTRIEFYAKKNNVGRAPSAVRPPAVESAGNGSEMRGGAHVSMLGKLNHRNKIKAISQMFLTN